MSNSPYRPRRILQVISSSSIGGGQTHAMLLMKCLKLDRAFEVQAVCHPGGRLEKMISDLDVPVDTFELEDLKRFPDMFRFLSFVKTGRFDLIHAHLNRACLFSCMAGRLFSIPTICTAHGLTKAIYYRFADRIIAVSEAVARHLVERRPALRSRITVIHNGVPTRAGVDKALLGRLKSEYMISTDERVLTVIGKLHPNKGQHVAIRAVHALPRQLKVRLLLVGTGPDERRLKELVKLLSIGPRVTFIEDVPRLNEIYAMSDFVLVPSMSEALSLVVLEALRQERPVIASDTGGIPEIIVPGRNGVLVEPNNPSALAKAIEDGLKNYRLHEKMASAGKRVVLENFGIDKCYRSTRKVFLESLGLA